MKNELGWTWPSHERHLLDWMHAAKPPVLNGRPAYQGKKQIATLKHCRSFHTAVDVGAHIGLWAWNLSHAFQHVVAFEPVAEHRECFKFNVDRANVTLHDCALGAISGSVAISTTRGSSGDSKVAGTGDIPMKRLDEFDLQDVDLIKIDAEGYEENVLIGAVETIMRWKPVIVVEQKRAMAEAFGLKQQGALHWLKALGYVQAEELSGDHIMVPK